MTQTPEVELAAAKVNLFLNVTGKRPDVYHDLESLVVFADIGDRVSVTPAADWSLTLSGQQAHALDQTEAAENLVIRAGRRLLGTQGPAASIDLHKLLPVAAGIGGGSADAAACIRALSRLFEIETPAPGNWADLGGDIPVCLMNRPTLVRGMGERVTPIDGIPSIPAVLVNPGVPTSTGAVFAAMQGRFGTPLEPFPFLSDTQARHSIESLVDVLHRIPNTMTDAAISVTPIIRDVLELIDRQPERLLARMSGSGATCFGLFPTESSAAEAASRLRRECPESWWIRACTLTGTPDDQKA